MSPVFGEGECIHGIHKKCRLGDKGVEYDPIVCLTCAVIYLADSVKKVPEETLSLIGTKIEELKKSG